MSNHIELTDVVENLTDSYATHKHPKGLGLAVTPSALAFHFTPTSASWLNAVENFFSKMTRQRIRRGVFRSVVEHRMDRLAARNFALDGIEEADEFTVAVALQCSARSRSRQSC